MKMINHLKIKKYLSSPALILILFFCAIAALYLFAAKPQIKLGDGGEYFLTLEAISQHQSLELRSSDVGSLLAIQAKFNPGAGLSRENSSDGYLTATDNQLYATHFWLYPLVNLPVKTLLRSLSWNELETFTITNLLLLLSVLVAYIKLIKLPYLPKVLLGLLLIFNPLTWFLRWPHTEVFSYSLVILSLLFFKAGKRVWPVLFSALAATQNPPLLVLTAALLLAGLPWNEFRRKNFTGPILLKTGLLMTAATPVLLPFLYFLSRFGQLNPQFGIKAAGLQGISALKVWELFFDPNLGLLPYALPLLLGVSVLIFLVFSKRRKGIRLQLLAGLVVVLLEAILAALTTHWNHGTIGPSRYVLWSVLPWLIYSTYLLYREYPKIIVILLLLNLLYFIPWQLFARSQSSDYRLKDTVFTPLAQAILYVLPESYNPSWQIFQGRVSGGTANLDKIQVYTAGDKCRKAFVPAELSTDNILAAFNCRGKLQQDACQPEGCYYSFGNRF